MRSRSVLVSLCALAAVSAGAPAAAHAATVLDTVPAITQVSAWNGTVAWSTYDSGQKAWRLVFSQNGGAPVTAPIAPSPVPFDVDLGTNRNGSTYAVYTRCATPPSSSTPADRGTGCDVYRLGVATGREEHLTSISSPTRDERDPTIFRGEIAFVRDEPVGGKPGSSLRIANTTSGSGGTHVLTKTNTASVRGPELTYDRVAYIVDTQRGGAYGFGVQEVHTRTLSGKTARNLYRATSGGANLAQITNIALADGDLHAFLWGRTNEGSGMGNRIVRYDAGDKRLTYAVGSMHYQSVADAGGKVGVVVVAENYAGARDGSSAVVALGPLNYDARP